MRKPFFACAKTKTHISFAVTAKLISAFVFALRIVQSLYYLNPKFQASIHLLLQYSLVCVGPGRKPRRPVFSQRGSFDISSGSTIRPSNACGTGNYLPGMQMESWSSFLFSGRAPP